MGERKRKAGTELQGLPVRLSARMTEMDLTQNGLAKLSGVDRAAITRMCNGSHVDGMTCETAIRLSRSLGVSLDWLLCGTVVAEGKPAAPTAPAAVPPTQIVVMVQPGSPQATAEALAQAAKHFAAMQATTSDQRSGSAAPVKRANKRGN